VGVIRAGSGLAHALAEFAEIERTQAGELRNMAAATLLIAASAFARTESRGGHFRSDFPKTDAAQARRSFITLSEARRIAARAAAKAA
jgi:L-aspartate oxidase